MVPVSSFGGNHLGLTFDLMKNQQCIKRLCDSKKILCFLILLDYHLDRSTLLGMPHVLLLLLLLLLHLMGLCHRLGVDGSGAGCRSYGLKPVPQVLGPVKIPARFTGAPSLFVIHAYCHATVFGYRDGVAGMCESTFCFRSVASTALIFTTNLKIKLLFT